MFRWRGWRWHGLQVLIAVDQMISAILLGSADETISSRVGKAYRGDYGPVWQRRIGWWRDRLNSLFRCFGQADHAKASIEEDEG